MAALQNRSTQGRVFRKLECKGQKFVKLTFPTTANEFTSLHASICPVLRTTPAPCKSGAEELRFPRAAQLLLPGRGSGEPVHQSLSPHAQGWLSPPQMYGFPETFTCCLSCHDQSVQGYPINARASYLPALITRREPRKQEYLLLQEAVTERR